MLGRGGGGFLQEVLVVGGLLAVQCVLAGYVVFINRVLAAGADPLALITIAGAALGAFFLPFAVALERKKWPAKVSPTLMAQFVLIALGGTTVFQALMLEGIKKTTPAIASAMPNLAPGLIFLIAACFRLEKFDRGCKYTRAKMLGTLVCLAGAMAMSFLQSPPSSPQVNALPPTTTTNSGERGGSSSYSDWILGCSYLLAAVVILSCNTVLQAATLISFPAPLSLCSITAMMGAIFTAILQLIIHGEIDVGSSEIGLPLILEIAVLIEYAHLIVHDKIVHNKIVHDKIAAGSSQIGLPLILEIAVWGGVGVGACVVFQTWCLGKKGPLLVSIFGPVQTVCSALISALLFRQIISLGSFAGIVLMFCGLYIVLWAKNNEVGIQQLEASDVEKSLLS